MKRNIILITMIVALLLVCLVYVNVNATPEIEYDIVTVQSVTTTHNCGREVNTWNIEYDGNLYVYTDLEYPVTTKYLLADVSKRYPVIICDIQIKCVDKETDVISRTYVTVGIVRENKDGEVIKDFEIVEYKGGYITIYRGEPDDDYNYISYHDVDCGEEDAICTVCDMNTENFEQDDIIKRTDKVIAKYTKE